jgi:hypothetical protein
LKGRFATVEIQTVRNSLILNRRDIRVVEGARLEIEWIVVHHTVEVIDADHIESVGGNSFYRLNGEVYRSGCSAATGTRFE